MIPNIRQRYNEQFSEARYQAFLDSINSAYGHTPPFRIAETPVFISRAFREHILKAVADINQVITRPDFKALTSGAIPPDQAVPNETDHTMFLQMDFGVCADEATGELTPQLIEIQGFPSLYCFQHLLATKYREHFDIPEGFNHLFNGYDEAGYLQLLRDTIVGDADPKNVVLLEIEPRKQITQIDFWAAEAMLGIKVLCISELKIEGRQLYYFDEAGRRVAVHKIYNRVIFDELLQRGDLPRSFSFDQEIDAEWMGHPNWFFRISKYTMPLLDRSPYVPDCNYLSELREIPEDLENYVLKPLFSFAGSGVKFHVNRADIDAVPEAQRPYYMLQRKVHYAPFLQAPDGGVKAEIRMLMLWPRGAAEPILVNNLVRLSKGEMIGVRYNKDKRWVGASVAFFEP